MGTAEILEMLRMLYGIGGGVPTAITIITPEQSSELKKRNTLETIAHRFIRMK